MKFKTGRCFFDVYPHIWICIILQWLFCFSDVLQNVRNEVEDQRKAGSGFWRMKCCFCPFYIFLELYERENTGKWRLKWKNWKDM